MTTGARTPGATPRAGQRAQRGAGGRGERSGQDRGGGSNGAGRGGTWWRGSRRAIGIGRSTSGITSRAIGSSGRSDMPTCSPDSMISMRRPCLRRRPTTRSSCGAQVSRWLRHSSGTNEGLIDTLDVLKDGDMDMAAVSTFGLWTVPRSCPILVLTTTIWVLARGPMILLIGGRYDDIPRSPTHAVADPRRPRPSPCPHPGRPR